MSTIAATDWWHTIRAVDPALDLPEDGRPLVIRLADFGRSFARNAERLAPEQRARILGALEGVLRSGSGLESAAVAVGFLETLFTDPEGFDLRLVWADLGHRSRSYCLAWHRFSGMEAPEWIALAETTDGTPAP
ncbi:hypothetical protein CFP65_6953 [Kitasatospora sp. MMS16-BH015]|uniref:hypothetical protein n=1 Tax=Kitasatospora sp. MMS16-BH015 TaxID=2018025 RepID=UPI000CA1FE1B|nr:hypothetical protein [Kitasatospora sp. MMS16-BH015]AUG81567.1 hypothetical protein CFP65_6953 [Kitasatospora sp. MMS16-BH015]